MKKDRVWDQRRYRLKEEVGRELTGTEMSLLKRYTVAEAAALIRAKEEMISGEKDILRLFGGVLNGSEKRS